jgi:hypothetical protein
MVTNFPPGKTSGSDLHRRQEIAALIARLLQHYWTDTEPAAMRRAQAEDWLDDLAEFEIADVQAACADWRRMSVRRPMIADIRLRCTQAQTERQQRRAVTGWNREAYARSVGFDSWEQRQDAIRQNQERYAVADAWRQQQREGENA